MTKFLLIQLDEAMGTWAPVDVRRHLDFQLALDAELAAAGELIESCGVAGRFSRVRSDGTGESTVDASGRPSPAAYRVVDVESEERALEIAARASAAPGRGGVPLGRAVDVRQLLQP